MASSYSLHKREPPRSGLFDAYDNNNLNRQSNTPPYSSFTPGSKNTPGQSKRGFQQTNRPFDPSTLGSLESQAEDEVLSGISARVKALKDLSSAIGKELKESDNLLETMTVQYGRASSQVSGTMKRMLQMAASTGVGWKVWLGFFGAVAFLFWFVWL